MQNPWPTVPLALLVLGCCFGDFAQGFSEGFNESMAITTECPAMIATINASSAHIESIPDSLAGVAAPTPEQIATSMDPLAAGYDQAASQLAAVPVTNPQLLSHRDALVSLYREGGSMLRTQEAQLAAAARSGDMATVDAAVAAGVAAGEDLDRREADLIARLNATCAQFQ